MKKLSLFVISIFILSAVSCADSKKDISNNAKMTFQFQLSEKASSDVTIPSGTVVTLPTAPRRNLTVPFQINRQLLISSRKTNRELIVVSGLTNWPALTNTTPFPVIEPIMSNILTADRKYIKPGKMGYTEDTLNMKLEGMGDIKMNIVELPNPETKKPQRMLNFVIGHIEGGGFFQFQKGTMFYADFFVSLPKTAQASNICATLTNDVVIPAGETKSAIVTLSIESDGEIENTSGELTGAILTLSHPSNTIDAKLSASLIKTEASIKE